MAVILGVMLLFGNLIALYAVRAAIQGRITPETMAGIRTNATRATPAAWEAAHRAAWPWALPLNGLGAVGGIAVMVTGTSVAPFLAAAGFAIVCTIAGALAQVIVGHRAATRELDRAR